MTRLRRGPALGALAVVLAGLLPAARADAIPAFARKYSFSCTTCHAPAPRLKAYGEEFAGNGFRLEEASKEPTRATQDVGDPLLKLARDVPLAFRLEGYASYKEDAPAETDLEWPWVFKILSGGPISDRISYYFYFLVEEGEVVGLEDAYVQFNDVLDLPVDLLVGQFQVCDPLFKRELRLTREDYEIFKVNVGQAAMDLTYDRGLVATWHAPAAVDLLGMAVNGNGISPAADENFDSDAYKSGALRVVRAFGPARAGLFGYWGREEGGADRRNTAWYWGPDLMVEAGPKLTLSAEYLERRDSDPFFTGDDIDDLVTRGGFVEAVFLPHGAEGRWVLTGLYNKVDSDDPAARRDSGALNGGYLLARNVRLGLEGAYDFEAEKARLSLGLVTAF